MAATASRARGPLWRFRAAFGSDAAVRQDSGLTGPFVVGTGWQAHEKNKTHSIYTYTDVKLTLYSF